MKETLIDILRQEQRDVEMQIAREMDRPEPDPQRLKALRAQENDLRRQLDSIPET